MAGLYQQAENETFTHQKDLYRACANYVQDIYELFKHLAPSLLYAVVLHVRECKRLCLLNNKTEFGTKSLSRGVFGNRINEDECVYKQQTAAEHPLAKRGKGDGFRCIVRQKCVCKLEIPLKKFSTH